jgi:hypothetical protein
MLFLKLLFHRQKDSRPERKIPVIKSDLRSLDIHENILVWFGHSSYMIQMDGRRFLIDPVSYNASPVSFVNRPFAGTNAFNTENYLLIDFLIIAHDHWEHLDCKVLIELRENWESD